MGTGEEQFCLRWNDFQDSLVATLQDLRDHEDLVDVTLVCPVDGSEEASGMPGEAGGGSSSPPLVQIGAHKIILSACSDFFRQLLRRNPATHPLIVLWDVSPEDARNVLKFMYNGEVEIRQKHLNTFLSVAERLKVRGLCQSGGKSPNPTPPQPSSPGVSRLKRSPSPTTSSDDRRRSDNASPSHKKAKNQRRPSSSASAGEDLSVKEENIDEESHSPQPLSSTALKRMDEGDNNHHMRRSGSTGGGNEHESETEMTDYSGFGPAAEAFDDRGGRGLTSLMGMPARGILDPATAKGLVFRTRQPFSPEQLAVLERYYEHNRYISAFHRMELAAQINLTERQVNVWFCNRRRKDKNLAQ